MADQSTVLCAWCGQTLARVPLSAFGAPVWHGMCAACLGGPGSGMFPTQSLYGLSSDEYDKLPFGLMELDASGRVLSYNAAEEQLAGLSRDDTVGKNFFTEVAPCTRVQQFEGVFHEMVNRGETARETFDFVFRFAAGDRFVHIALCYEATTARALIIVQVAAPSNDGTAV